MVDATIFLFGMFLGALVQWWFDRHFRRINSAEQYILDVLGSAREPLYGLEMVSMSHGLLKRGTVYVLLGRLQDRGLVEATGPTKDGRRMYRLTSVDSSGAKP